MTDAHPLDEHPWHALTWLVWALAGTTALQLAPNPVYVAVVIGIAAVVVAVFAGQGPYARAFPVLVAVGVCFAALRVVLTALTTHNGIDVLFTTPSVTLPDALGGFAVGGSIDAPIVVQAAVEGLVIIGVIAVFAAFNAVVSHHELVQILPRAFYEIGLIIAVGVAFVPSTITAIHDVREADRARTGGRVVRRGRLVRQLVPILESGLERAMTLAESMDSRGFAHGPATVREHMAAWSGAAALLALGGAFVALVASEADLAIGLGLAGGAALVAAVAVASRGTRRTRYRPRTVTRADGAVMTACVLAAALLCGLTLAGDTSLSWTPSPLRWPALHALPLLSLLGLLAPLARRPAPARHAGAGAAPAGVARAGVPSTSRPALGGTG